MSWLVFVLSSSSSSSQIVFEQKYLCEEKVRGDVPQDYCPSHKCNVKLGHILKQELL